MNEPKILFWSDDFATGVAEIDDQHKILLETLREAGQTLNSDHSTAALDKITRDLLSYALYHFDTEEQLMREYRYLEQQGEAAARHQEQHRTFSAKVVEVREALKSGIPVSRNELLDFLSDWLAHHILNTDKLLGAHIRDRRSGRIE